MSEIDHYKKEMQKARSEIIDDLSQRDFIVFAGAGVSETAGVKLWEEILKILDENQPDGDPKKKLNVGDWDEYEYPELAQILFGRYLQRGDVDRYYEIIENKIQPTKEDCCKVQNLIVKLSGQVVTTNYDNTFENAFKEEDIEFSSQRLPELKCKDIDRKNSITYLHGNFLGDKKPEIILKTEDYAKYYSALNHGNESCVERALSYIYNKTTKAVLFHGFSFGDRFIEKTLSRLCEKNSKECYNKKLGQSEDSSFDSVQHYAFLPYSISSENHLLPEHKKQDPNEQNRIEETTLKQEKLINEKLKTMKITVIRYEKHRDVLELFKEIEIKRNARRDARNILTRPEPNILRQK